MALQWPFQLVQCIQYPSSTCRTVGFLQTWNSLYKEEHWKIFRRDALSVLLEIRTNTGLCHIGLVFSRVETERGCQGRFHCKWSLTCLPKTEVLLWAFLLLEHSLNSRQFPCIRHGFTEGTLGSIIWAVLVSTHCMGIFQPLVYK